MNALRHLLVLLAFLATLLLLVGCGGGGGGGADPSAGPVPDPAVPPQPGQALQVIAVTPTGADAALDAVIEVEFSALLDAGQFPNPPLLVRQDGGSVAGTIDHDAAAGLLRFTPTQPFAHCARIEVTARAGITDVEGHEMTNDVVLDFTTRLPRLGVGTPVLGTPDYEQARLFKTNAAGAGALVFTDAPVNANATLKVTRYETPGGVVATDDIGYGLRLAVTAAFVHVAENGDILVPWLVENGGQRDAVVRIFDASAGVWGNQTSLEISPTSEVMAMSAGVAANGDALIAWSVAPQGTNVADRVYVKSWDADMGWGGTFSFQANTGRVRAPHVAMGRSGHAVLTWGEEDTDGERVHAVRWSAPTGWSACEAIDDQGGSDPQPQAAVGDAAGRVTVLYREMRAPAEYTLWAAQYFPTGMTPGWQPPVRMDDVYSAGVGVARAGVDVQGRVVVAWPVVQATEGLLKARRFHPLEGWRPLKTFARSGVSPSQGLWVDVAEDGTIAVAVQERAGSTRHVLAASWEPAHGIWSSLEVIATTVYDHFRPAQVRAWRAGHVFVAWLASDGDPATHAVLAAGRWVGPTGALGPVFEINDGTNEDATLAGVGIDREGRGAAVWSDLVGGTSVMNHRLID
ncbi:MAG: Ig-like domain-containing protein [Planctomycetota bacterium]|nr:Ig-like domain-containing protein [Planctomycetota bacterium]